MNKFKCKQFNSKVFIIIILGIILVSLGIFQLINKKNNIPEGVVAYAYDWEITQAEYEDVLETNEINYEMKKKYYAQTQLPEGITKPPLEKDTASEILNRMIEKRVIQQKAVELGIKVEYEEVEARIIEEERIRQEILENGSDEEKESIRQTKKILDEWLDKKGITEEEQRERSIKAEIDMRIERQLREQVLGDVSLLKMEEREEAWNKKVKQWVKESNYKIANKKYR